MANTYTQMNVHAVFAVKGRENIITKNFRDELYKYVYGIRALIEFILILRKGTRVLVKIVCNNV